MFFYIKQKTSYEMRISDWSSDVCSSDLLSRVRAITTAPMQDVRWDGCGDLSGPQTRRSIGQTGDRPPSCSCDFRPMCDPRLRYGSPTPAGSNVMKAARCATRLRVPGWWNRPRTSAFDLRRSGDRRGGKTGVRTGG